jgi:hypothetical protein
MIEIAQFIASTLSDDEVLRAMKLKETDLADSLLDNSHWLYRVVWQCQEKPYVLDWARERDADFASITLEEIRSLAAQFLVPSNALRIDVMPEGGAGGEESGGNEGARRLLPRHRARGGLEAKNAKRNGRKEQMKAKHRREREAAGALM